MAVSLGRSQVLLQFGAFEVDLRAGELRKNGLKVRLQEQPFQILAMLLARPGEVVTRDEVRQKLWPADTFVDFDHGLNNAVNRVREALGDSADSPRFIETVARRGYRFVASVNGAWRTAQPLSSIDPPARHSDDPRDGARTRPSIGSGRGVYWPVTHRRSWMFAIGAGALVTVLGLLIGLNAGGWRHRLLARGIPTRIQSVAVLPFDNLTGDSAQEYFADGMTDALITELAQTQALRVISRTSAMQYKGAKRLLPQLAKELNVDAVVEGTVRRSKDRVWITAQLIDAVADRHLWAKPYERELRDVPALQTEMARDIVREMHIDLTAQERTRLARTRSVDPEAYDLYLRGRFHAANMNKQDVDTAIESLERAVAIDLQLAPAYVDLAHAFRAKSNLFKPEEAQWREKALAAANRALSLEPHSAEAHLAKAEALDESDHVGKIAELRRALSINPNLDDTHHRLGNQYNHVGLLDKAADELQQAIAINPANAGAHYRIGLNLLFQSKYEQAIAALEGTRRFSPSLWGFHMAWALFHVNRRDEAAAVVNQSLRDSPRDEGGLLASMQAMLAAAVGDEHRAEERIQGAIAGGKGFVDFHHTEYAIGSTYALLNKPEAAVTWLQKAAVDGFPCYPLFEKDTNLDHLRHNARFLAFMANLKKQWLQNSAIL
jgi:TolB-like protein/DNA-binding winged helix-turn-helix (wHTH) protein